MRKTNITERTGNRSNDVLPDWYREKLKVMAEVIMKTELAKRVEIASPLTSSRLPEAGRSRARNDVSTELEVVVK